VWSAGLIFYELLNTKNQIPQNGENYDEIISIINSNFEDYVPE
jgi:hypothetical protein